jgi:hypothetical protein
VEESAEVVVYFFETGFEVAHGIIDIGCRFAGLE